jgi:drug/metabolite transporter (DMT)-like permease
MDTRYRVSKIARSLGSPTACGLGAILMWSTTIGFARSLSEKVGPLTAGASVFLLAGIISAGRLLASREKARKVWQLRRAYLLGCGGLFVFYQFALFLGVGLARDHSQVLEIGLLNYLWPALIILFSLAILNKKGGFFLLPGTLLALTGVYLVLTQDSPLNLAALSNNLGGNPVAYLLVLSAAISWALYSNLTRRWAGGENAGGVDLFLPATGLVLLLLCVFWREGGSWDYRAVAEAVFQGVVMWAAYCLWDVAMRRTKVTFVAACAYFTPLFSTAISCLYLGVSPGTTLWIGCLPIIAGSWLSSVSVSDREPADAE